MYLIYTALLACALLVSLPYWLLQMLRLGKYRAGLKERFGNVPPRISGHSGTPVIWIHAVSVGEVLAITGVVKALSRDAGGPCCRVVVSTTTATGQKLARQRFGEDNVFYFPLDIGFAIRPYLQALRPQLVVLAETEFWPNFLRLAHDSGARVAVVNARISDRSLPGYRRFRGLLSRVLSNVDLFLAQTDEDAHRLAEIGAPGELVRVSGNLKYDVPAPAILPIVDDLRKMIETSGGGPVIVAGSTVEDEEALVLSAFDNVLAQHPRSLLILAPRHPERFNGVAALLNQLGIRFWRRSQWNGEPLSGGVLLLDGIGELAAIYSLADVAFVGGSLVPRGGHNIIEPAQHGVAIIVGNHTENFRQIVGLFQSRNALRVTGPAEFPLVLIELVSDPEQRSELGRRALETLKTQTGATQRTVDALQQLIKPTAMAHQR